MGPRILFYAKRNLHLPHMEPIRRWLGEYATEVSIRVASPPYAPPREALPGVGLTEMQVEELRNEGIEWMPESKILGWSPDATIVADADLGGVFWGGKFINVNHGLISKGTFYTTAHNVMRENALDLICVPGEHHASVLRKVLKPPVVATGFVKFDPIGRGELTRETARDQFDLPRDAEVVTLAPTFNLELSAVPVLADGVRNIVADHPNRHLLIKLHGMAPMIWTELYNLISTIEPRIHVVHSVDLTPSLMAADVVISDVSSAFMEAVALDRPVVLVDNPLQKKFAHYDPNDIEYAWRDVGLRCSTAEEILAAVNRSFENPAEKAELRAKYGPRLVGPIDGKAAERAGQQILQTISRISGKRVVENVVNEETAPPVSAPGQINEETDQDSPRKLLFVCHDFPPFRYAGAQLYALHLAKELIRRNHDVRVLYALDVTAAKEKGASVGDLLEDSFEGVPVYQVVVDDTSRDLNVHPQHNFENPVTEKVFQDLLLREDFDAIHFHLLYRLSGRLPSLARQAGIPTLATLHDYWMLCSMGHMIDTRGQDCTGPESPEKCATCMAGFREGSPLPNLVEFQKRRRQTLLAGYRDIDRVFAPSAFLAKTYGRYGFPKPQVLPLGWLPIEVQNRRPVDPGHIVFSFSGQIQYRKGLDVMLKAFAGLKQTNWELRVHGKNYQPGYFEQMIDIINKHPRMSYRGEFTPSQLSDIFSDADVAIVPSRRENYPLTILEAQSAGLPIIASRVGGIPEMIKDGQDGFLFESDDPADLQQALVRILDQPERLIEMRDQLRPPKNISTNTDELEQHYQRLIAQTTREIAGN